MLSASSRSSLAVAQGAPAGWVAVEATSRPRQFGYETQQLRLEGIVPRPGIDGVSALTPTVPLHTNPKRERGLTQVLAAEWEKTIAHASG